MSTTEMIDLTKQSEYAIINERLISLETKLTEMYEIFCKLYQAYVDMASSPMFTALVGKMGK